MATKTNAVRLVQQAGFSCQEVFYDYSENDLNGECAAKAIGFPSEQVFKTLVAKGDRTGINVFCIPVCCELNLKLAAKVAGEKNIALIPVKDLQNTTGYVRGGCSPIGMKRKFPTFIDETCQLYDTIAVSAGERGHQMIIPYLSIVQLADAKLVDIIAQKGLCDMQYEYKTKGTCSQKIFFEILDGKLTNTKFIGGCNGNLQGICKLVEGMPVDTVIEKIEGIRCGIKQTSCPDQLAKALKEALNTINNTK